jgi:Phosphatidylinositol-4-phosphate 5-Kinase
MIHYQRVKIESDRIKVVVINLSISFQYRINLDGVQHYFVVMRNVFSAHLPIQRKFDLKGSTVDREASDKELEKRLPTLKDNDFIKQKIKIVIGEHAKQKLLETLNADVNVSIK